MKENTSRALLYGGAVLLAGAAFALWSNAEDEADIITLLSSADVQLRTAYAMPPVDDDGNVLDSRDTMIASAIDHLQRVERISPGMAVTAEFRGFAHMLEEEYVEAADCYARALSCADVGEEQRDILAFNQARMLAEAGRYQAALRVFEQNAATLDGRYGHQRRLEEAKILRSMGRVEDAIQRLEVVRGDDAASSMARLQAGQEFLALGLFEAAEQCLTSGREELPIADYHLARLKMQQGETDTGFELLRRAFATRPAEVRRMLRDEANAWSVVAGDPRFKELTLSQPASPGR